MSSSFFEFNIATSGLFAAKAGLELVAHNTANIATVGYSRQYIKQRASSPLDSYSGVGQVGTGTEVYGIGRIRDEYLDRKFWPQVSTLGEHSQKYTQLSMLEVSFNALSETSLTNNINSFFTSISDLTFSADSLEYRTSVVNTADTLITNIKNHASKLKEQQEDLNDEVYSMIETINSIGKQIADMSDQIYKTEIDGHMANELRDQRTVLIDTLSQYVNIETKVQKDGTNRELGEKLTILINGQEFISHSEQRKLETTRRQDNAPLHPQDALGIYDISWENGDPLRLKGLKGELKGIIDMRDGDSGDATNPANNEQLDYKGIPYYINKLTEFVRTIACAMNEGQRYRDGTQIDGVIGHTDGFDMHGENGRVLFTYTTANGDEITTFDPQNQQGIRGNYDDLNVFNIQLNSDIKKDPSLLATSDSGDATQESNNKVILGFLTLKNDTTLFSEGGAYQFANALSSTLGIDTKQAKNFTNFYTDVTKSVDNQRLQVSSVSLNEEVANMVKYQHLYQISSKLINVINEVYNTTINGLGV